MHGYAPEQNDDAPFVTFSFANHVSHVNLFGKELVDKRRL